MTAACGSGLRAVLVAVALLTLSSCATSPPSNINDLCAIFQEKPSWRTAAMAAETRWGTPVPLLMAFVRQESGFRADARPPRPRLLGLVPWFRDSTAFGYAQAKDETWQDYGAATSRWFVSRSDFGDSVDFIGWYGDAAHRKLGIALDDTFHLYVAYHEGLGGYAAGAWRRNGAVRQYAQAAVDRARRFEAQLRGCP